jgi:hypothetical protein
MDGSPPSNLRYRFRLGVLLRLSTALLVLGALLLAGGHGPDALPCGERMGHGEGVHIFAVI